MKNFKELRTNYNTHSESVNENWMDDEPYSKKAASDLIRTAKKSVSKLKTEDDFNDWMSDTGYTIIKKYHKPGPFHKGVKTDFFKDSGSDLFARYKKELLKALRLKFENVEESSASWAKSLEDIAKKKQLDKISDKDKKTLMKIAAMMAKEKK